MRARHLVGPSYLVAQPSRVFEAARGLWCAGVTSQILFRDGITAMRWGSWLVLHMQQGNLALASRTIRFSTLRPRFAADARRSRLHARGNEGRALVARQDTVLLRHDRHLKQALAIRAAARRHRKGMHARLSAPARASACVDKPASMPKLKHYTFPMPESTQ